MWIGGNCLFMNPFHLLVSKLCFRGRFLPVTEANFQRYLAIVVTSSLWFYLPLPENWQNSTALHWALGWGGLLLLSLAWFLAAAKIFGIMVETNSLQIAGYRFIAPEGVNDPLESYDIFTASYDNGGNDPSFLMFILRNTVDVFTCLNKIGKVILISDLIRTLTAKSLIEAVMSDAKASSDSAQEVVLMILEKSPLSPPKEYLLTLLGKAISKAVREKIQRLVGEEENQPKKEEGSHSKLATLAKQTSKVLRLSHLAKPSGPQILDPRYGQPSNQGPNQPPTQL